nr:recombinase family protein [Rhodococcus pyridinivorans]
MLIGYARVSGPDQNPDHQVDALRRARVAAENIHIDHAGGRKRHALNSIWYWRGSAPTTSW